MKKKSNKILGPIDVIKKYLVYDWIYYFTPFVICLLYAVIMYDYHNLQHLVCSVYSNLVNVFMAIGLFCALPNVVQLIFCQRKVLQDMPSDIILKAASSERYGGAGAGKTSSAVLQAIFEAASMEQKLTSLYYYIKSNYERWAANGDEDKIKAFAELEKSVLFWRSHPEYIPFLGSNVTIHDANGRRSYPVDKDHLCQEIWLPSMFIIIDEAGNEVPQELYKDRPAAVTMFFRYIRHFGFRISLLEQKQDGIYINVRAVLGATCLAMGQSNRLMPVTLIEIIDKLKNRLSKYDADDHPDWSDEKKKLMNKKFVRLGHFIEILQDFSSKLGFRIWHQLLIKCPSAMEFVPPEEIEIFCTNEMPVKYDDREFSELYLPKDENPVKGNFVTKESEAGKKILRFYFEQEEKKELSKKEQRKKKLKIENDIIVQERRKRKLEESNNT